MLIPESSSETICSGVTPTSCPNLTSLSAIPPLPTALSRCTPAARLPAAALTTWGH